MRDMAREILESLGYHLIPPGWERCRSNQFASASRCDSARPARCVMPKLDGIGRVRTNVQGKAWITGDLQSGYSEHGAKLAALATRARTILQKPYGSKDCPEKCVELLR